MEIEVPTDEILTFAEAYGVSYFQTSAKDSVGVEEGFKKVIEEAAHANLINMAYNKPKEGVIEHRVKEEDFSAQKKKCC